MTTRNRYLLGYGERLTSRVKPPGGGGPKDLPYTLEEAVARLQPMAMTMSNELNSLPALACPGGEAVGVVTMHPQWIAKSYHPGALLRNYGLRQVGSRPVSVVPEKWSKKGDPTSTQSTSLYVAGERASFKKWADDLTNLPIDGSSILQTLETIAAPTRSGRIHAGLDEPPSGVYEVALHARESATDNFIVQGFEEFTAEFDGHVAWGHMLFVGGLCFVPIQVSADAVARIADYAFLRAIRPMPRLRGLPAVTRAVPAPTLPESPFPEAGPVDSGTRIAVFDGGLAESSVLTPWSTAHEVGGTGASSADLFAHGHSVTSALLFGSIEPGQTAQRPYLGVDHYRVLDADADEDPFELYETLGRMRRVLETRSHAFVSLSIGPALPVEDDEVHAWTAYLDDFLSDGETLATIAAGNTGGGGGSTQESRIQVPADAVNALSVGAADSLGPIWRRASYSSRGPGRSPGVVKPEVLHFGGDGDSNRFLVYDSDMAPKLAGVSGTSFAAPAALRLAAGVRAHFGSRLSTLALKSLLVHSADPGEHDRQEVGWGRLPTGINPIVECGDGTVRIVYQGELSSGQYLRAQVPLAESQLRGNVELSATFSFATRVDPEDPGSYTRAGLEVTFRPHSGKRDAGKANPASRSFFKRAEIDTERRLRDDAQKWESTLHHTESMRASSLHEPVFDIHYNARSGGAPDPERTKIAYALVVTVRAPRVPDLYEKVVAANIGVLEPLQPVLEIPVIV